MWLLRMEERQGAIKKKKFQNCQTFHALLIYVENVGAEGHRGAKTQSLMHVCLNVDWPTRPHSIVPNAVDDFVTPRMCTRARDHTYTQHASRCSRPVVKPIKGQC